MKTILALMPLVVISTLGNDLAAGEPIPPQDKGLPYTRSAQPAALTKLHDKIGLFVGSRYGWVFGKRVRVDNACLLRGGEPVLKENAVYVPETFAKLLLLSPDKVKADRAPAYLTDRWVYTIERPEVKLPAAVRQLDVNGKPYVAAADVADKLGLKVYWNQRGLMLIGTKQATFPKDGVLLDTVITMFDTPETLADPDIATRYIPVLKQQGKWTDHVTVTPDQLKMLAKPEPEWPQTPRSKFDLTGFNTKLLGSKVPAPGMYPRLLFSEADLPMFRRRIQANKLAQKSMAEIEELLKRSWLDPKTSDGQVFAQLASGHTDGLLPVGTDGKPKPGFYGRYDKQKPGIYSSHINYNAQCLVTIAMYALLTDNDELGKRTANAIANYCRLGEPAIDAHLATSDSEWGEDHNKANNSSTHWRGMHGVVPHMDLPFLLDFGGKWMTAEQKEMMRRIIAKATYGRRTGAGDGPRRCWRDINHMTWHLTHGLAITTIEGLEGFDPEAYASHAELTRDFLEWGVDTFGQMFESNGKSGGGVQFQILSMIALARRGNNLWGHPHWRALAEGQIYTTAPNAKTTLSSGTWGSSPFSAKAVNKILAFYPDEPFAQYLLTNSSPDLDLAQFDLGDYKKKLAEPRGTHRMRLPGISYPDFTFSVLYDTDWKVTKRAELPAKTDWNDTVHGILSAYSDLTPEASWMCLHVRANHYMGSGHHHADVGMFYFSGNGINWFTESPLINFYDGKYHNEVLIDGIAEPDGPPARGKYLGAQITKDGAIGTADIGYAYSWRWCTQVILWKDDWMTTRGATSPWVLEDAPGILAYYQGTQRFKMRPWWATHLFSNWIPTVKTPYNPVQYVYRSAGLIRGAHSYGIVVDDAKKDDKKHLYQWSGILGPGVWQARSDGLPADNMVRLAHDKTEKRHHAGADYLRPRKGDPILIAVALGLPKGAKIGAKTLEGPGGRWNAQTFYDSLLVDINDVQARYRMLLIPMKMGDALPEIDYDEAAARATVAWADQTDILTFNVGDDNRTSFIVTRGGKVVAKSN